MFNKTSIACLFAVAVGISSCAVSREKQNKQAKGVITSTKPGVEGSGTIQFRQKKNEVEMKLNISFPSKAGKSVAVHIHEHGDCGNEGNNTHGHWNPTNSKHGKWGAAEFHLGDIGNVELDRAGNGSLTMKTSLWTIGTGEKNDIVGRGLIVHDGVDDYKTQPTGNAGSRIGCGIIEISAK